MTKHIRMYTFYCNVWIYLLVVFLSVPSTLASLCDEVTDEGIRHAVHRQSTPQGGKEAGSFRKVTGAESMVDCTVACCNTATCNVAFIHHDSCFLIECNATLQHGCDPMHRDEAKFEDTYMVAVRSLEETASLLISTSSTTVATVQEYRSEEMSCIEGLDECQQYDYESCVIPDFGSEEGTLSRRHHGTCKCIQGYQRNPVTRFCEELRSVTIDSITSSIPVPLTSSKTTSKIIPGDNVTSATTTVSATIPRPNKKTLQPIENGTASPVTSPPTTTHKVIPLIVSAGDNKVLELPEKAVILTALATPDASEGETYEYHWSLVGHPLGDETGQMTGTNTAELKLTNLIAGLYTFKVTVSSDNKFGEAFVNVTVKPPARINQPPVAIIKPTNQEVKEGNTAVLDGSESKDDDKIVVYEWEMISGPLTQPELHGDQSMFQLQNLMPGQYNFKLTVTDSDQVTNSNTANVTVIKDVQYPPRANAGSDVILNLPIHSVILNGNHSTDDKNIASYEWIKKTDELAADMIGVRTPYLHLSNLQEGDYTFTLKVTDTDGLSNSANVHVFVKAESSKPPEANAGQDLRVVFPETTATLDGSKSKDPAKIIKYQWTMVDGPTKVKIDNADRKVASASQLSLGKYIFKLTVSDSHNRQTSDEVTITVEQDQNTVPVADAGADIVTKLPFSVLFLDGSGSTDDKGIVSYEWTREDRSLAAGVIINGSDHQAVLQLTNLVAGNYFFTLKVVDEAGASSTDTTHILVQEDQNIANLVEMFIDSGITEFTEGNKKNLENKLALVLYKPTSSGQIKVHIQETFHDWKTGQLGLLFYVEETNRDAAVIQNSTEIVNLLKKKFKSESDVLGYEVMQVDTVVCHNDCSGHGECNKIKKCVCDAFWMENIFKANFMEQKSNCDWSILYVIIVVFVIVISLSAIIWGIICVVQRLRKRPRSRKRQYQLLEDQDEREKKEKLELLPRGKNGKRQMSSLMMSESELSSNEETIFINGKKNGHKPLNGITRPNRAKIKA